MTPATSLAGPSRAVAAGLGYARAVRDAAGRTALTHVHASSPLRLFTPRVSDQAAWIVTSTLGGGIVGGDAIRLSVEAGPRARLWLTTQASTKVYRSTRTSRQVLEADVDDEALLVSWPDPIVLFEGATFEQDQRFRLHERATLVAVDCVLSGREARGERWAFDSYLSRIEIARGGRPIFRDLLRLDADGGPLRERMGRFQAYAICVMTGPLVAGAARALSTRSLGADRSRRRCAIGRAAWARRCGRHRGAPGRVERRAAGGCAGRMRAGAGGAGLPTVAASAASVRRRLAAELAFVKN